MPCIGGHRPSLFQLSGNWQNGPQMERFRASSRRRAKAQDGCADELRRVHGHLLKTSLCCIVPVPKQVRRGTPRAEADLVDNVSWYVEQRAVELGGRVFDAAHGSLATVQAQPGFGSPAIGQRCGLPGLRSWRVKGFPLRWFYFDRDDCIDVIRLLADRQEVAAILDDETPSA